MAVEKLTGDSQNSDIDLKQHEEQIMAAMQDGADAPDSSAADNSLLADGIMAAVGLPGIVGAFVAASREMTSGSAPQDTAPSNSLFIDKKKGADSLFKREQRGKSAAVSIMPGQPSQNRNADVGPRAVIASMSLTGSSLTNQKPMLPKGVKVDKKSKVVPNLAELKSELEATRREKDATPDADSQRAFAAAANGAKLTDEAARRNKPKGLKPPTPPVSKQKDDK